MPHRCVFAWGLLAGCWAMLPAARAQEPQPGPELPTPQSVPAPTALPLPPPDTGAPGCPSCGPTITVPRLAVIEEQEAITIPRLNVREEVVGHAFGPEVDYRDEKRTVTEWVMKPREVTQDFMDVTMMPHTVTDPCTGQCRTEYTPCPTPRQIKTTVYDMVPVPREVVIRVPVFKPGVPLEVRRVVVDNTTQAAILSRMQVLPTPTTVPLPQPCPAPACPLPHP
jgi:hypothetical protein